MVKWEFMLIIMSEKFLWLFFSPRRWTTHYNYFMGKLVSTSHILICMSRKSDSFLRIIFNYMPLLLVIECYVWTNKCKISSEYIWDTNIFMLFAHQNYKTPSILKRLLIQLVYLSGNKERKIPYNENKLTIIRVDAERQ